MIGRSQRRRSGGISETTCHHHARLALARGDSGAVGRGAGMRFRCGGVAGISGTGGSRRGVVDGPGRTLEREQVRRRKAAHGLPMEDRRDAVGLRSESDDQVREGDERSRHRGSTQDAGRPPRRAPRVAAFVGDFRVLIGFRSRSMGDRDGTFPFLFRGQLPCPAPPSRAWSRQTNSAPLERPRGSSVLGCCTLRGVCILRRLVGA